ncbi:aldehyde dehydrogenase family protein [Metabacillus indicus]|uniref:aldehyde dehydrogenase family protein n=1 Tax=Metabacillus indicus TaxID=246786 RepID=UPI002A08DBCE|nr:aldehyde dehydrogenase family protein [Metabacillus indicus]MDX8290857.1 aldehyde dehydrogenase family protein [Metabacillus indicus]
MEHTKSAAKLSPAGMAGAGPVDQTSDFRISQIMNSSRRAFASWREKSTGERLLYLKKLKHVLIDHMEECTEVLAADTGKVKIEAVTADLMPVLDTLSFLEKNAEKSLKARRVKTPIHFIGKKSYIEYMPRGAALIISPWNYPLQLALVPVVNALAAGNTVILKPSEITAETGLFIEKAVQLAGFPDGVIQVVHGGKETGQALVKAKPDFIFFTGSAAAGKKIQEEAAKTLIPVTLELGGKDPFIVFEDANLERAAKAAAWGSFTNSGQVCMSTERIYVQEAVYETFLDLLVSETVKLKQGRGEDDDIGAMTHPSQLSVIKDHVEDAVEGGARLIAGALPENWEMSEGLFIKPMVFADVKQHMKIMQEETFGPVAAVMPFQSEEEAIALANDSVYGLNASVWSKDLKKAKRVTSRLETGNAVINDVMMSIANQHLPFGGVKQSGIGKYHGKDGIRRFCHEKSVMVDRGRKKTEMQWYPYKNKYTKVKSLLKMLYGRKRSKH